MYGGLSIGVLVAFQSLLAGFNQPFRDLARLGTDVQELRADLDRIDDVRNRPIDPVFTSAARSSASPPSDAQAACLAPQPRRLSGHIEFRRVTFGYNRTVEEPLIKEFSFVARPGQRIALVGSSGSGKSTIGRLAAGLYQPWSGEILYDGKPSHDVLSRGLRQLGRAGRRGYLPVRGLGPRQPDSLGRDGSDRTG